MDAKTLRTLEFDRLRGQLAELTAFAPSRELALKLTPTANFHTACQWLDETAEARLLLETEPHTSVGGARDIRELVVSASKGNILVPGELLDVKFTIISARSLSRQLEKAENTYPFLSEIALSLPAQLGLVDAISSSISDRGEILDSASAKLGEVRAQLRIVHDRLLTRMQKLLSNKSIEPYLQESLVTQRDGRYVIPIKVEARGRVKSVVHDVSSSGATLFVEPLQVVDLNNEYRELQVSEKEEERRILAELSSRLGEHAAELQAAVNTLAALDLVFAKAKFAEKLEAIQPKLVRFSKPKNGNPGMVLKLWQARHPLLDPETVVPIDVETDPETYILLITGPNTGGKTVTLKTVGLLACMAQSGLHIPALEGSEISLFKDIYADIGDEQSIEQSLSTFSGHITNIIKILMKAGQDTLVILDELGAGTDPQEGAALAQAILTFLVDAGIPTLVATHYPELKAYAHSTPGVVNASMAFDMETLRPTYHLTIGLPGRSNALHIAERLGLPEEIVQLARGKINPTDLQADDLLDEIQHQRDLAQTARSDAEKLRRRAEDLRLELTERLESIEDERLEILADAREKAQAEIEALQEELRKARRQLAQARQPLEVVDEIEEAVHAIEDQIEQPAERQQVSRELPVPVKQRPIRLGDKVKLRTLGKEGVVSSLGEEQAEIMVGNLRVRVDLYDLELAGGQVQEKPKKELDTTGGTFATPSPGVELSLRGYTVDEALERLEHYLDRAYISGLPYARIVHGKGTGRLRDAVRKAVCQHPYVERFEPGGRSEGGDGVTVVFLVKG